MDYIVGRRLTQMRISVMASVAECVFPVVLPTFATNHPDLDVVIERAAWPAVIEDVAEGRLDAAVANMPSLDGWVREEMLSRMKWSSSTTRTPVGTTANDRLASSQLSN